MKIAGYDPEADAGQYHFDQATADRYVTFIEAALTHTKGELATWPPKPFLLDDWQRDFISTLFGWVDDEGYRRYRDCFLFLPRKNGKSTLASAITLAALFCDGESGAECYLSASSKDQSGLIFEMATGMIRQNPDLDHLTKIVQYQKRIEYGGSYLRAIPADDATAHGFNVHIAVGDELHAWKRRDLFDVLRTGRGARRQPLCVWISTAGSDRENICYQLYEYAQKVRDQTVQTEAARTFLPVLFEAPKDADWTSPEVWKAANPGYGTSVSERYLREACDEALDNTALQNTFRRLHLNQWQSQVTRWLNMLDWDACPATKSDFDPNHYVYAGLDFSVTTDFSAWCLWQPATGIARWRYWLPEERAGLLERTDMISYSAWVQDGFLSLTPGGTIDFNFTIAQMLEDCQKYEVHMIGCDMAYAGPVAQTLTSEGYECVKVAQTPAVLTSPCNHLYKLVADHALDHGNNPITTWMADNVEIEVNNANLMKPAKPKRNQTRKKIDGIAALINAIQVALSDETYGDSDEALEAMQVF